MPHQANCVFCKIVQGQLPATQVHEDDLTLTFMDISPAAAGHTLVIAKAHFETLFDIDETNVAAVAVTSRRIAGAIQRALQPAGLRVSQLNGSAARQSVFHYHVHLIPVYTGEHPGTHGRGPGDPEQIRQLAARIQAAL